MGNNCYCYYNGYYPSNCYCYSNGYYPYNGYYSGGNTLATLALLGLALYLL